MGVVARRLGKPLMPWQQYVADVILEIDPETGRLAYNEFGLTVPRQSGKSTLILAKSAHRCSATGFFGARQRLVYTAQTRAKAREKWEEDYAADLEAASAFKSRVVVHKGNGNEHIRFTNGSRFGIDANTEKAGHGGTLDEAYIDEAFAQVDFRLEQAFGPAMITRLNKQLGWISTAGWVDASPYLEEKVRLGRLAVDQGRTKGLAYFEWSASEEDDPGSEETWARCMPALGHTIRVEDIRAEFEKARDADKLNDFRRAYLNLWVPKDTTVTATAVDPVLWADTSAPGYRPWTASAFAIETDPEREWSAVAAAGPFCTCAPPLVPCESGVTHVDVVEHGPGTDWVVARCVALAAKHDHPAFVVDGGGPAASLIPDLEEAGLTVRVVNTIGVARSYGLFMDALKARTVRHDTSPPLEEAVKLAKTRPCGDGGQAFGRKVSGADISPLVAVSLAHWAAVTDPPANVLNSIW